MKKHHKTTMKYATESVLNFRSDSLTRSECAVHSRTLKADLIISFHIFFLCFFQVCAVMLQLYPCLFSLQNQILIELKWEILSYWYAKWRIWVSWSAASELSLKLYLISPLYNLCSNCCFFMNFNIFRKFCGLYLWTFSWKSSRNIDICPNTMSKVHTMYNLHSSDSQQQLFKKALLNEDYYLNLICWKL